MKISNEAKIGIIAIIALGMLIWGISFLKGKNLFSDTTSFYAIYSKMDGVSESTPVLINGYKIGRVHSTRLLQDQNNQILLRFEIQKDYFLPKHTIAEITSTDLLGGKALTLKFPEEYKEYLQPGDTLETSYDEGLEALTSKLESSADNILSSVDSVLSSVNALLDSETREHMKNTIANINNTSSQINRQMSTGGEINATIKHISEITATLAKNKPFIDSTIQRIAALSESVSPERLDSLAFNLNQTIEETNSLIADINQGKGSVGQLMQNDSLYMHLTSSMAHLDSLLIDLEKNPKRYVHFSLFGKKED